MFEANAKLSGVIGIRKIRRLRLLAALMFIAGRLVAQTPAPTTVVKAGRLLDPRTGNVLAPAAVLAENGKIKEVGSSSRGNSATS